MVYRFAERLSPEFTKSHQPERVAIIWRYNGSQGLPVALERAAMDALEDAVNRLASNKATLAYVSTGNNQRQWVYYTKSADNFIEVVRLVRSKAYGAALEFETALDPEWNFHDEFVRAIRR